MNMGDFGWNTENNESSTGRSDYFHLSVNDGPSGDLWSVGTWVWYDFTPKVGLAFRGEYLNDPDGVGINVADPNSLCSRSQMAPACALHHPNDHGNLASFTLTLNLKPVPDIKIQPEIRYDTTSYAGGFNGKDHQIILGCGASYLF